MYGYFDVEPMFGDSDTQLKRKKYRKKANYYEKKYNSIKNYRKEVTTRIDAINSNYSFNKMKELYVEDTDVLLAMYMKKFRDMKKKLLSKQEELKEADIRLKASQEEAWELRNAYIRKAESL